MNILITGSEGFIGLNLVKELKKKNVNISGLGRSRKRSKLEYNYFQSNLLKKKKIPKKLNRIYDVIIHGAGLTSHSDIVNNKNFEKDSLKIARNTLDIFLKTKSKHFIFLSSGKVYTDNDNKKIDIYTKTQPNNKLGSTKLKIEKFLLSKIVKSKLSILRIFLVYGKGQNNKMLIPEILNQIQRIKKKKQKNLVLGNLEVKGDFIFINDLIKIILNTVFEKNKTLINVKNVASGHTISPKQIALALLRKYKVDTRIIVKKSKIRQDEPFAEKVKINNKTRNFYKCINFL